jgi:leader peptidase (prepilin peptidase) / N-methyltransferase
MDVSSVFASVALVTLLAAASALDFRERRLPDIITLPLVVVGLGLQFYLGGFDQLWLGVLGAGLGFLAFWTIAKLYRVTRGVDGLGLGDAKLLAAAGAWLGPVFLAPVVFVGAMLALLYVQVLRLGGEAVSSQMIVPFGPFLSVAFFGFWCVKLAGWSWF